MKNAKKLIALLLSLAVMLAFCACGKPSPAAPAPTETPAPTEIPAEEPAEEPAEKIGKTVLKCAYSQSIETPGAQTLLWISDQLFDATDGRYSVEVHPSEEFGDPSSSLESLIAGKIELAVVTNSVIEYYVPDFAIIATPYMFDSSEHQERVFESDCLNELFAETGKHGFNVLCAYTADPRNLFTRDGAITTPEELSGLRISVMGSQTCVDMIEAMGAAGRIMAQSEVYDAIQNGGIDGVENSITAYVDRSQYAVAPYCSFTCHLMVPDELTINKAFFDGMSAEDRAALTDICRESQPYFFKLAAQFRSDCEAKAAKMGVIFSQCDVAAFQKRCQSIITEKAELSERTAAVYQSVLELR